MKLAYFVAVASIAITIVMDVILLLHSTAQHQEQENIDHYIVLPELVIAP